VTIVTRGQRTFISPVAGADSPMTTSPTGGPGLRHLRTFTATAAVALTLTAVGAQPLGALTRSPAPATAPAAAKLPLHKVVYPTRNTVHRSTAFSSEPQLQYWGGYDNIGVVSGPPRVYLVFWGSQWGSPSISNGLTHLSGDPQGEAPRVQQLFQGIGTNAEQWSGVMTQYCEGIAQGASACAGTNPRVGYPVGGAFAGLWVDNGAPAPAHATGNQIAAEADTAASHFGNSTTNANRNVQYVVMSPTGTHPDGFNAGANFCAWHSWEQTSDGDVAFTNLPYITDLGYGCGANFVNGGSPGTLDGVTIVEGHEYAETLTDPTAYAGWFDNEGEEIADKCAWISPGQTGGAGNVAFANGSFAMQSTWANDGHECELSHAIQANVDFAVNASPASLSVPQGGTAKVSVSTTLRGTPDSVALSVTGTPAGMTATYEATPISSGTATKLDITVAGSVTTGTYPLTLTGSGTSTVHSKTVNVKVVIPNNFSLTAADTTLQEGKAASMALHTAVLAGVSDRVKLSTSRLSSGVTATFAPSTVSTGGTATLTLHASSTATLGQVTITISGVGTSYTRTATFALTVTAADDYSLSADAGALSIAQGSSDGTTIEGAVTVGVAQSVRLSTTTIRGITAAYASNPMLSSGSSDITISIATTVRPGTYAVVVNAQGPYRNRKTTITVTVTPAANTGILNGDFESGDLTSWTSAGTTSATATTPHGGSYSAALGSTSATNGASSIARTFTAGAVRLSFAYEVHCGGVVANDWFTVTLIDNSSGRTQTLVAPTCNRAVRWLVVNTTLNAGDSYTLTFTNHDDNNPATPTWTQVDDITTT
jgi:serine protease